MTKEREQQSDLGCVIAADVGGTNLRAAVIDQSGRVLERYKQPTPKTVTPVGMVKAFVEVARELMQRKSVETIKIRGAGDSRTRNGRRRARGGDGSAQRAVARRAMSHRGA
ncbi:MAG: ROK family protein [Pyrinomonadaceae bacterium]